MLSEGNTHYGRSMNCILWLCLSVVLPRVIQRHWHWTRSLTSPGSWTAKVDTRSHWKQNYQKLSFCSAYLHPHILSPCSSWRTVDAAGSGYADGGDGLSLNRPLTDDLGRLVSSTRASCFPSSIVNIAPPRTSGRLHWWSRVSDSRWILWDRARNTDPGKNNKEEEGRYQILS